MDDRLTLAASLYTPCALGADIGTDHGFLPCYLLEQNICQRMLLSDVSPSALSHAEALVARKRLQDRATLICADGLDALTDTPAQAMKELTGWQPPELTKWLTDVPEGELK